MYGIYDLYAIYLIHFMYMRTDFNVFCTHPLAIPLMSLLGKGESTPGTTQDFPFTGVLTDSTSLTTI